uniref:GPN-loop GTPase 2 n=1 Tax=Henneguya salminicola TaxID=69463 RepID=A0A6G3MJK9_HENSL
MEVKYGQVVVGAPGCGKTIYCKALLKYLIESTRNSIIVNLDPANDIAYEECTIDIRNLITVENVMERYKFGPNGALLYCMQHLLDNKDWLITELLKYTNHYIIFDCPGQSELYSTDNSLKNLLHYFSQQNYRV